MSPKNGPAKIALVCKQVQLVLVPSAKLLVSYLIGSVRLLWATTTLHTILTIPCNFVPRGWLHILRALLPITFHAVLLAIVAYNNLFISKFTIQIHYCVETVKTYHIRTIFISFKHTTVYIRFLSVIQSQSTQRNNI